jgi:hypothetical protein
MPSKISFNLKVRICNNVKPRCNKCKDTEKKYPNAPTPSKNSVFCHSELFQRPMVKMRELKAQNVTHKPE